MGSWVASARKALLSGLAVFGLIVSATALLRLLDSYIGLELGEMIQGLIGAYQALFYPLLDLTLGKLLIAFDISVTDRLRDSAVLYVLVASSLGRLIYRRHTNEPLIKADDKPPALTVPLYALIGLIALLWPISIPFAMVLTTLDLRASVQMLERDRPSLSGTKWFEWTLYTSSFHTVLLPILIEIAKVILIAAVAIIFNEAGIL